MKDLYVSTLKKYVEFKGRASKKEFWTFVLINIAISIILGFVLGLIKMSFLSSLFSLAITLPTIAVGVRRMNDIGKEWWYILIPIYSLILALQPSEEGANKHGEKPVE